jgi:calcium permeable stress-gated cation channel
MMKLSDTHVLNHHSIDGYLLLRFLKVSVVLCLVGCFITWPVLFPVNATGGGGYKQLALLSYQNINIYPNNPRLYAHTFIAWIYFGKSMRRASKWY